MFKTLKRLNYVKRFETEIFFFIRVELNFCDNLHQNITTTIITDIAFLFW